MAIIRPFRAIRYNPKAIPEIGDVLSPPFDVITESDNQILQEKNPHNIVRLELGKREEVESEDSNVYLRCANQFLQWQEQQVLIRDEIPAFYLVREKYGEIEFSNERTGLFAAVKLEEFTNEVILPHEQTAEGPKRDRLQLMKSCEASFSPILGLYRDGWGLIDKFNGYMNSQSPDFTAKTGTAIYEAWLIKEQIISEQIEENFRGAPIFIADGHHRYETALNYRDFLRTSNGISGSDNIEFASDFILMCLVEISDPGMQMLSLHRVIPKLSPRIRTLIWEKLEEVFTIEPTPLTPSSQGINQWLQETERIQSSKMVIGVLDNQTKNFYNLSLRVNLPDSYFPSSKIPALRQCNTWILQNGILEPTLGEDISKVEFVHEPKEVEKAIVNEEVEMIFLVSPISMDLFEVIVSHGERLPRKSTYFFPKLATGLFMYNLKGEL